MIEFFIAFLIGIVMILGTIQVAMLFNARSMVKLAAFNAARAAIVARDAALESGVRIADMQAAGKRAAFLTIVPVVPSVQGQLKPEDLQPAKAEQFAANLDPGAIGASPDLLFELNGTIPTDQGASREVLEVRFIDPDAADPSAPGVELTDWPEIEFDERGATAAENLIKVRVTWQYPLVIPFINRVILAIARPALYGRIGRPDVGQAIEAGTDNIQVWALGSSIERLVDDPNNRFLGLNRIPVSATYLMRMQWDRRPN